MWKINTENKGCLDKIMKDVEEATYEWTHIEEIKIIFKDTDRDPLIIKKPEEAYWIETKFKYKKERKEHFIHECLIAELEIIYENKKESEENVKSKR